MYIGMDNEIPGNYPLGINGLSDASSYPNLKSPMITHSAATRSGLEKRLMALWSSNTFPEQDYATIDSAIKGGRLDTADALISVAERKIKATKKTDGKLSFSSVTEIIPDGWRLSQERISGVPNWAMYAVSITGLAIIFRAIGKKRKR